MEILTTVIVEEKTLNVGDTFDIGNGISIIIHELFDINGQIYMATTTENHDMMSLKLNEEGTETFTPNRYINPAVVWVRKNAHLFN
jgi:hypothetical protein